MKQKLNWKQRWYSFRRWLVKRCAWCGDKHPILRVCDECIPLTAFARITYREDLTLSPDKE